MKIRKSAESPRKVGKRRINPIIIIVCEGKETEVEYFSHFDSKYTRINIIVADKKARGKNKGKATDCESLVKKAIYYKNNKYDINEKDGDRVWCIFDTDINHNNNSGIDSKITEIKKAQSLAYNNKIRLGISNPCFELWYLLHFKYTTTYLKDYNAVKKNLEKETPIKEYEKNKDIYALLEDKIAQAIENGKKLEEYHKKNGKILFNVELDFSNLSIKDIVESNPYTNVMCLVEYIEKLNCNVFK